MYCFLDTMETGNNTTVEKSKGKRSKETGESLCAVSVADGLFSAGIIVVIVCDNGVDSGDLPEFLLGLGTHNLKNKDILHT